MAISFLDCTLRDGGCVNDFKFGTDVMRSIKGALEKSGVKYIELGYIDKNKGSCEGFSMFIDEESIERQLLQDKDPSVSYLAMIDCGKYPVEELPECSSNTLDGIRLCFHKSQIDVAFGEAKKILDKGYRLFLQPMICTRYSEEDTVALINRINLELPNVEAVYVVDSFGAMSESDFVERCTLISSILNPDIRIGIHSHNNQSQSFDVISTIIGTKFNHDIFIDCTIAGIGKGAGNPNTIEILHFYNSLYEAKYNIEPIKEVDAKYIEPIRNIYPWGYSYEFFLCAKYKVTPSYLKFYKNQPDMGEGDVELFLSTIPEDKKDAFSKDFAVSHLTSYASTLKEER